MTFFASGGTIPLELMIPYQEDTEKCLVLFHIHVGESILFWCRVKEDRNCSLDIFKYLIFSSSIYWNLGLKQPLWKLVWTMLSGSIAMLNYLEAVCSLPIYPSRNWYLFHFPNSKTCLSTKCLCGQSNLFKKHTH